MENNGRIAWLEIEKAPDMPGLYAWYLELSFGQVDLENPDEWKSLMSKYTKQHRRPQLEVNAKAFLGLEFEGKLQHTLFTEQNQESNWPCEQSVIEMISQILRCTIPIIAAPLYVGIARKSLRERLMAHKRMINQLRRQRKKVTADFTSKDDSDETFACRVVDRNVDVNHLSIYIIPIKIGGNPKQLDVALQFSEFIINRLYYPILGRR